jgi:hypothetical protein
MNCAQFLEYTNDRQSISVSHKINHFQKARIQHKGLVIMEKRAFQRLPFSTTAILSHNDAIIQGQLENISMNGALVRLEHGTFLPQGSEYCLTVHINGEDVPLQLVAEIVCVSFSMAGIKFVSYEADTKVRLSELMVKLSSDLNMAMAEHERIRRQFANYLREE